MEAETKQCPNCDAKVGKAETICPSCKVNFEELEDAITTVERAQNILAKRKTPPTPPTPPTPAAPVKKQSVLSSLGKAIRSK